MARAKRDAEPPTGRGGRRGTPADGGVERWVGKVEDALAQQAARHEEAAARVAKQAERHQKLAEQVARRGASLDRLAEQLRGLEVWTRERPSPRRPRFQRDDIAAAAVRIADEEGFDALSMRHLAEELGAGTMTLYHYVKNKDELLALTMDHVMAEIVIAEGELPSHWRDALAATARRSRDALLRHPWCLDITDDPPVGPNGVRHFDQTMQAVADLPVDLPTKVDIVSVVDEYVFGYCLQQRNNLADGAEPPAGLLRYIGDLLTTGDYPQLTRLTEELGVDDAWQAIADAQRDDGRFERNLARVLDGIEASLPKTRRRSPRT